MGDKPAARQRQDRPASRIGHRVKRAPRAVAQPVVRKTRAVVVKVVAAKPAAGRHRAAPPARHATSRTSPVVKKRAPEHKSTRKTVRKVQPQRGMDAVVAFARRNVGHSYGGEWDCSGFVKKAYAQIGINLPHQSEQIAARAYTVSRSQARPGDIVVGPGHVGIYMGRGMMIDSGNPQVGVSYRPMYSGLHIERLY